MFKPDELKEIIKNSKERDKDKIQEIKELINKTIEEKLDNIFGHMTLLIENKEMKNILKSFTQNNI